jgi:copper chaperone CopZ
MATHVLQTKFWYIVVGIVAVGILALIAVEVAGRPREMKLRVAGMHCEGCVNNVTAALKKIPGVQDAEVKFVDTPAASGAPAAETKPVAEEKKLGVATITVAGLHSPSEKELQDAVHELAGENFEVKLEK